MEIFRKRQVEKENDIGGMNEKERLRIELENFKKKDRERIEAIRLSQTGGEEISKK
ncbi:MAG: hypothetical protein NT052_01690 [Candidatus Shapirobacteria bacterium]|nr:hypothetical protein [Candidatus Shapirobacteria bacterium]